MAALADPLPLGGNSGYSIEEKCEIEGFPAEAIIVEAFDVEAEPSCGYDYLEVTDADGNQTKYCGSTGPDGVVASGAIEWVSDGEVTGGGWRICFGVAPPLPPLPPLPPPPPPSPPSPPHSPPSPPLQPGSMYAFSSSDLIAALNDSAVSRIVLVAGIYEFADSMCEDEFATLGSSELCIDRDVTIEAEVAGSVVLDSKASHLCQRWQGRADGAEHHRGT